MTFQLTPEQFHERATQIGQATGTVLSATAGEISHEGVIVAYTYDGATLDVQVKHKPRLVPESFIESKITGWFKS